MSASHNGTWTLGPNGIGRSGVYSHDMMLGKYYREQLREGTTFYFNRWVIQNTIEGSKHPWRLKNRIELTDIADKQHPKRLFAEQLEYHNIPSALIFRAGLLSIAGEDDVVFTVRKHVEWWLYFGSSADRCAAILLL